jgi:putative glutamine amidotransferase
MANETPLNKPVIGVTTSWRWERKRTYSTVSHYYTQSVLLAGGLPLLIPLCEDPAEASNYAAAIDGLLLTGGDEDVAPYLYGENPIAELQRILPQRDHWEFALLKAVLAQDKPILGICRGVQVINAALGGSLYQHLGAQYKGVLGHYPGETEMHQLWHKVKLEPGSRVFQIFDQAELMVNSFHNQAVKALAPGFLASAYAEDGVLEAIESTTHRFLLGVQWHPEALTGGHPRFIKLFSALTRACRQAA